MFRQPGERARAKYPASPSKPHTRPTGGEAGGAGCWCLTLFSKCVQSLPHIIDSISRERETRPESTLCERRRQARTKKSNVAVFVC